jgi:chromosome partitioning protein
MQRQVYPQTAAEGLTIFDSGNAEAIEEIKILTDELMKFITTETQEDAEHGAISKTA